MSKNNITQFKNPASLRDTSTVTLQSAIESMQTWRRSKTKLNEKHSRLNMGSGVFIDGINP